MQSQLITKEVFTWIQRRWVHSIIFPRVVQLFSPIIVLVYVQGLIIILLLEIPEVTLYGDIVVLPMVTNCVVIITVQQLWIFLLKLFMNWLFTFIFNWEINNFSNVPMLDLEIFYPFVYFSWSSACLISRIYTPGNLKFPINLILIWRYTFGHQLFFLILTIHLVIVLIKPIIHLQCFLIFTKISLPRTDNSIKILRDRWSWLIYINYILNILKLNMPVHLIYIDSILSWVLAYNIELS